MGAQYAVYGMCTLTFQKKKLIYHLQRRFGTIANLPRDAEPSLTVFMDLIFEDDYNKEGIRILILQVNYSSSPARMSSPKTQLYLQTIVVKMVWE